MECARWTRKAFGVAHGCALEWSYLAGETEARAERFKSAAELLVLRHDTLKLIDGAGPKALPQDQNPRDVPGVNGKELVN